MSKNCDKVKYTCGSSIESTCTNFEGTPNTQSPLISNNCLDQEIVDQDQYNQLGDIWGQIDLSALGSSCLTYVKVGGKVIVKNALLKYEQEICDLKTKVAALENRAICDIPITSCLTTFNCLALPCDTSIKTLGDWMKAVQIKICTP